MFRKILVAVSLVAALAGAATTACGDDATVPPSYFEGTWTGSWPAYLDASSTQDITIAIRRGKKEGVFVVEYEWAPMSFRSRTVPGGKVKAKGTPEGDTFAFGWENREGREMKITLRKQAEDSVKARIDRGGPLRPGERPYSEATLKRK